MHFMMPERFSAATNRFYPLREGLSFYIGEKCLSVLTAFILRVQTDGELFLATSDIIDIYEDSEEVDVAIEHYLSSLADELAWFEAHKETLSPAFLADLERLRHYVKLV